jgi:hypothetical protein
MNTVPGFVLIRVHSWFKTVLRAEPLLVLAVKASIAGNHKKYRSGFVLIRVHSWFKMVLSAGPVLGPIVKASIAGNHKKYRSWIRVNSCAFVV